MNEEQLSGQELEAWRTFLSANVQLMERLDQDLQQRSNLNLTDYEILSSLAEADDRRLRMSDLAREVLVSRSRLTYRIDRLAEVAFVVREECQDDRRGLWAILTDVGHHALQDATPGHFRDVRTWFFDLIGDGELDAIAAVMARIDEKLSQNTHRPPGR